MDVIKYFKERDRVCTYFDGACENSPKGKCPLYDSALGCMGDFDIGVPIVEKWGAEHPQKTRLDDFKEKYPNARMILPCGFKEIPDVCCKDLGYIRVCKYAPYNKLSDCADCWNQPLEEENK